VLVVGLGGGGWLPELLTVAASCCGDAWRSKDEEKRELLNACLV